jgi:transposase-like protein
MAKRIAASEATRERLQAVMDGKLDSADGRGALIKLAARLIVEEALEAEVGEALGRDRYERGEGTPSGYRNGVRTGRVATAEGMLEYAAPQLRDMAEPFVSAIRPALKGRTGALEDLAVELYARGLSTRDIEKTFAGEDGRSLLGRAAVSQITERLWADYEAFSKRDLGESDIVYLFVGGIAERLRPGLQREAVIAAWGIGRTGAKVLLGLMAGSKEDTETMRVRRSGSLHDLRSRGLGDPLLVASDGAPGIVKAIEECFPRTARQRCLAHRMRNLAAKAPSDLWPEFKASYRAPSRAIARDLANGIIADYGEMPPSAVKCFADDFEACIAHLRMPVAHRRAIRTTNLLERLFGEERRRLKIVPNAFGEKPVLKLMFASLIRAAESWRGLRVTEFELRQLDAVRKELNEEFEATTTKSGHASQPRVSSSSIP